MASGTWSVGEPPERVVRPVIARSWARSLALGLAPASAPAADTLLTEEALAVRREGHPLRIAPGIVERAFAGVDDPHHLI
ncbi:MAG: hypothetical protein AAGC46_21465, partial [Solirubrobacteraceae bacterium]